MNKIDNMIGFAVKSGNISLGYKITKADIHNNRVYLVVVASDISAKIKEKLENFIGDKNIYYIQYKTKEELGELLGKNLVGVLGIKDENMTNYIIDLINQEVSYEDIRIIKDTKRIK
ncbi:MAG: ribosomal L7Ae/L30e/S12e/Gadd45 family protein [Bacillota bacterium]|nr:ribosomal L7Ae/L30e/S12e/Gadd45 family protein [Bacillota bacterium]